MREPSYAAVKNFCIATGKLWLNTIELECRRHTPDDRLGPYLQFRTDWINEGLLYALQQTLRYVGFGYVDYMIFKDLGRVIGKMLVDIRGGKLL